MKRCVFILLLSATTVITDASDCLDCHAGVDATLSATPHDAAGASCVQCHGSGEVHEENPSAGNILTFDTEPPATQDAACATCHADAHAGGRSAHARAGVPCASCHSVHGETQAEVMLPPGFDGLEPGSAVCAGCHEDVLAQFAFNERHRLAENAVTCIDCHDPHQTRTAPVLHGAVDSACSDCHADVEGPFLFEHAASRVDGCIACHSPHGSSNRHLLSHQSVGELCYSCHAGVPQFHLGFAPSGPPRFGTDSVCTNCHVTIHGSNLDRLFLK